MTFQLCEGGTLTDGGPYDDGGEWPENYRDVSGDGLFRRYSAPK